MDKKKLLLIFALILIICFILLVGFLWNKNQVNKKEPGQIPIFTPSPTPTIKPGYTDNDLFVTIVDPTEDASGKNNYSPIRRISFNFNKNINRNTLNIQISPELKIKTTINANNLIIQPEPPLFWTPNTVYTITIKQGLASEDGATMKQDYIYQIQTRLQGGE